MKIVYKLSLFYLIFLIFSCNSSKEKLKDINNVKYTIVDTLNLSGHLLYDNKLKSTIFVPITQNKRIDDTISYARKKFRDKTHYVWLEPYILHRYFNDIDFCHKEDQEKYLIRIKNPNINRYKIMYLNNEDLVLINSNIKKDRSINKYISFKCW